jgi:hypothetical protein
MVSLLVDRKFVEGKVCPGRTMPRAERGSFRCPTGMVVLVALT